MKLNNGIEIPQIGYGVYGISQKDTQRCVLEALKIGYRLIDTAQYYHNEKEVGEAIKNSNIPREDIFVTTKIYGARNYEEACQMIEKSLERIPYYIDLMLIHWPSGDNVAMYKAMEKYYKEGKIKAIGISNFYKEDLDIILENCEITPSINQLETHIFRNQKEMQKILKEKNIILEAWSPLASATNNIFENIVLSKIGKKHNKTNAQIALRYLYQQGIVVIPKTSNINRMKENKDIEDFALTEEEMNQIDKLNKGKSLFGWY